MLFYEYQTIDEGQKSCSANSKVYIQDLFLYILYGLPLCVCVCLLMKPVETYFFPLSSTDVFGFRKLLHLGRETAYIKLLCDCLVK